MQILIENQIDELTTEQWYFYQTENRLYLDKYYLMKREDKKKRNYRVVKRYDRLMERDSTLTEAEVPFTEEIRKSAIKKYSDMLQCLKWSEK